MGKVQLNKLIPPKLRISQQTTWKLQSLSQKSLKNSEIFWKKGRKEPPHVTSSFYLTPKSAQRTVSKVTFLWLPCSLPEDWHGLQFMNWQTTNPGDWTYLVAIKNLNKIIATEEHLNSEKSALLRRLIPLEKFRLDLITLTFMMKTIHEVLSIKMNCSNQFNLILFLKSGRSLKIKTFRKIYQKFVQNHSWDTVLYGIERDLKSHTKLGDLMSHQEKKSS